MESVCSACGQLEEKDLKNNRNECINIRCKFNITSKCPICNKLTQQMGDDPLLYDCDKCNYIWSYHDGCLEISNPSITPSEFIGHLLADSDNFTGDCSVEDTELSDYFVKSTPYNIEYEDCSTFVWKCAICGEKYANMYKHKSSFFGTC